MAKGYKVSSTPKTPTVDNFGKDDSDSDDDLLVDARDISLPSTCDVLEKIERREATLEKQEDLLIFEKERNLIAKSNLAKEKEKSENLAKLLELSNFSNANLKGSNKQSKRILIAWTKLIRLLK